MQLFEGMKAYRGPDNKVRLFRPMINMKRMLKSAHRACLPVRLTFLTSLLHPHSVFNQDTDTKLHVCFSFSLLFCRVLIVQSYWSASGSWWRWIRIGFLTQTLPVCTSVPPSWAQRLELHKHSLTIISFGLFCAFHILRLTSAYKCGSLILSEHAFMTLFI